VLVTLDTTRADRIGAFGADGARTPRLDRLAAEGAAFLQTYATSHLTIPSHVSIMSSLPVATHGAVGNARPPRLVAPLLPSILRDAGYRTAAFVGASHLGRSGPLGIVLGDAFDVYRSAPDWRTPLRGEQTTARVRRWLRKACGGPFFAWVHYWDPHMPYAPPPAFQAAAPGHPETTGTVALADVRLGWPLFDLAALRPALARYAGAVRALKAALGLRTAEIEKGLLHPDSLAAGTAESLLVRLRTVVRRTLPLNPPTAAWLRTLSHPVDAYARYAGEVSYADHEVGALVDVLDALGVARDTIVVVVADHGESLGEHGIFFDHQGLYEPTVRVPLVVWAPGRVAPGRHTALASTLDVAPTILALLGIPSPPAMHGRDLLAAGGGAHDVVAESMDRGQLMLRRGPWKLIRTERDSYYTDVFAPRRGTCELYHLATDPDEVTDLAATHPEVVAELSAALDAWEQRTLVAAPPAVPVDELRALGYLP